ncbi:hypothetical protein ACBQ16_05220 [Halopseudomonas bauzanensis]|uniref:hypothetical protein n=1 Tax=Halopseudomonas bauzanensis TaxID=653930 RepID=UPI0035250BAA
MNRLILIGLAAITLTGCSLTGHLAKEGALSLTERNGREHFTLAGELPANFMLQATTKYAPLTPEHCKVYDYGLGREVMRDGYEQEETGYRDRPHEFKLKIPLNKSIGLCRMEAYQVSLLIRGRYGEKDWQTHRALGGIGIAATRPQGAPEFSADGVYTMRGYCTWLFQINKLYLELGKALSCSETDETWQLDPDFGKRRSIGDTFGRDELPGKTVYLDIREYPEEQPFYSNSWIRFPSGWKLCQPKEGGWIGCQEPPVFKTFLMDGQECTVYPNCREQPE